MSDKNGRNGRQPRCPKCGAETENGVCPQCGHKIYVPMDEVKLKRIRFIVGAVLVAAALILFIVNR